MGTIRILLVYIDSSFFRYHLIRISILVIGLATTKVFTNSIKMCIARPSRLDCTTSDRKVKERLFVPACLWTKSPLRSEKGKISMHAWYSFLPDICLVGLHTCCGRCSRILSMSICAAPCSPSDHRPNFLDALPPYANFPQSPQVIAHSYHPRVSGAVAYCLVHRVPSI